MEISFTAVSTSMAKQSEPTPPRSLAGSTSTRRRLAVLTIMRLTGMLFLVPPAATPTVTISTRSLRQVMNGKKAVLPLGPLRATNILMLNRSEEHTSELQSRGHLVCRLLLEKKKKKN